MFSGFYKLPQKERLLKISEWAHLSESEAKILSDSGALSLDMAERMVENVIGAIHLPLGVAVNFKINGKECAIPMAIEEPSVIAAASNAAKLCLPEGFSADADEPIMTGQVQVCGAKNPAASLNKALAKSEEISIVCTRLCESMASRGGGFRGFYGRVLETPRGGMLVFYFDIDVRDSMGANTVNTMLEGIAPTLLSIIGEGKIRVRVLTNLAIKRKARASAVWKKEKIGADTVEGILDAYELARADPMRAATNNKGIMNGISAVALATGNDWRAVEAGAHAYAVQGGKYSPLAHYSKTSSGDLEGKLELPLAMGTVGGSIGASPTAKIALKILKAETSQELACAAACAGLANNFSALRALSTEGIQKGHMELHARNLAFIAGAKTPEEADAVAKALSRSGTFTAEAAASALKMLRDK
jgi:hydroxymethylglutaryl-CoA reductase